jgi:hypothetical protein
MNPLTVATLASVFKVGGAVLGVPSLAVLALYTLHAVRQRLAAPPSETDFGDNPDAVLLVLKGLSRAVGNAAHIAGSLAQLVLDAAALAAGAGLVLALVCWGTGRGLQADATWARLSACTLLLLGVLVALLLALSLRGVARVPMFALVVLGGLALHAVWAGVRPVAS